MTTDMIADDSTAPVTEVAIAPDVITGDEWWRTAVIYQIYPRSFADSTGDGVGDLNGITSRLPALADLGVDAIWLSPFFRSPQNDAGYDVSDYCDVDPIFGTLADFDALLERAHSLGLKVIADMVPNHTSSEHRWFQEALAAPEGSPERDRYMFREGKGENGELPPNNWESVFGGSMWTRVDRPDGTPGQWYLHIFDTSQPDLNWENPWVREQFKGILRFWLDRGVDGFRVDVAHGMIKAAGLPDYTPILDGASMGGTVVDTDAPAETASSAPAADAAATLEFIAPADPDDLVETAADRDIRIVIDALVVAQNAGETIDWAGVVNSAIEMGFEVDWPKAIAMATAAGLKVEIPDPPYWGQEGVHEIWREWHQVMEEYEGDRVLCAEAWVGPLTKMALWVRSDEMHQAFNFDYMFTDWDAAAQRKVIDNSIAAFSGVGAPSTWVLSNHDVVRHASRLALTADSPQGSGIGPKSPGLPDPVLGLRRARAATSVMLSLPGGAYVYQGEELGLPEVIDIPDDKRQDPTWFRTNGEKYGRDGCRVPIPWEAGTPGYGFNTTGESWLPQPGDWDDLARETQNGLPGSTLELYKLALALRKEHNLATGTVEWLPSLGDDVLAFVNNGVTVIANTGETAVELPLGTVLLASQDVDGNALEPDATVWMITAE